MLLDMTQKAWSFAFGAGESRIYSDYFDAGWYIHAYPEFGDTLKQSYGNGHLFAAALRHYLSNGWRNGCDPNPYFDTKWYLEKCVEARRSKTEPLRHYVEKGWRDGLSPSVYFDAFWYLRQYPDVAAAGIEPLLHYLRHGWREVRNPNAYFDAAWYGRQISPSALRSCEPLRHYLEEGWRAGLLPGPEFDPEYYLKRNPGCRERGVEPLKHFLLAGGPPPGAAPALPLRTTRGVVAKAKPNILRRASAAWTPAQAQSFALSRTPLVSIIIPNFNGAAHLRDLFNSLKAQTYENFEIIFVDDNSTDDSIAIAESYAVDHVVRTGTSVGYAKANNLGTPFCSGELIALLNNDMRVDANWLEVLVSAIKQNPLIAAAAPKIRFWTKFQRITVRGSCELELDERALLASLDYKKYFVPLGARAKGLIRSTPHGGGEAILLHLPMQMRPIKLLLRSAQSQEVMIGACDKRSICHLSPGANACEYEFSRADRREAYYVINNAGSALDASMSPYDRGFGHVDDGEFDSADELDLFCGGAVLIRRDALHERELFISELGAYYEDSELALWLSDRGYKIVYCPNAIAYHKHSATAVERSAFWLSQTHRNKIIFDYVAADPKAKRAAIERGKQQLNHLEGWYSGESDASDEERKFAKAIPKLYPQIDEIVALIDKGDATRAKAPRIGVYNPYWMTLGGGEAHALDVASALSSFGRVELISESDFDVDALLGFFGFSQLNVRKRLISKFCSEVTRDYDIFVNSCYLNETPSLAKRSYFLVSFPSRLPSLEFRRSYYFLANSAYTLGWMRKFWGEATFAGEVLYPSAPSACFVEPNEKTAVRKKLILSTGRFVATGHTKNQLEIVEAFRRFVLREPAVAEGWTLALAGAVNDADYLSRVNAACEGLDVILSTNASFEDLRRLYAQASIYVHASGYGREAETQPELFEHFGIAVAQALASGCVPLVFDAAGPKEIVEAAGVGMTWRTLDELSEAMCRCASALSSSARSADMSEKAFAAASVYSARRTTDRIRRLAMYGS
jgi:GT2 family glycosyltransferase